MNKITLTAVSLSILLSSLTFALPKDQTFTALVSDVRLSSELIDQGKSRNDTASVEVKAIIFDEPLVIPDVRAAAKHSNPEINTIIDYSKSLTFISKPELLALWHPDDREAKQKQITPEALQAMQEYCKQNPSLTILGVIYQADTSSVLIKIGNYVIGYNLRKHNEALLLTDTPSNDLELAIIEASFSQKE